MTRIAINLAFATDLAAFYSEDDDKLAGDLVKDQELQITQLI